MIATQNYLELPDALFEVTGPAPSPAPVMVQLNHALLSEVGVAADWYQSDDGLASLSGNCADPDVPALALAYAGHQFGQWVPQLGDGRAHLLGQIANADTRLDVQLKGSGRTRFSRGGDGRATLGSVIREYLVSEAMAALGIPTTRALAVIATGEPVRRERAHPGAILARTAESHIRVGSFQYAAGHGVDTVRALADFVIERHFQQAKNDQNRYQALLSHVVERQAVLIAQWMLVGFIHGVMNTDNTSIVGETIDYGPCAFMDEFHPQKVFSSIDRFGRYAWNQQPSIAHWNLTRLAETLLPLLDDDADSAEALATEALNGFAPRFQNTFDAGFYAKLGIPDNNADAAVLLTDTFTALAQNAIDFTVFFDHLTRVASGEPDDLVTDLFKQQTEGEEWLKQWSASRRPEPGEWQSMRNANPALIARNHRVEEAISAAVDHQDYAPFRRLLSAVQTPYEITRENRDLQRPPTESERVTETFCGT